MCGSYSTTVQKLLIVRLLHIRFLGSRLRYFLGQALQLVWRRLLLLLRASFAVFVEIRLVRVQMGHQPKDSLYGICCEGRQDFG